MSWSIEAKHRAHSCHDAQRLLIWAHHFSHLRRAIHFPIYQSMSISRCLLMSICLASSVLMAQHDVPLPEKVTLLSDAELPVPFSPVQAIQPVKAGTEVFLRDVHGEQVKVAHGVGEGYLHHAHTDYAKRAADAAKNPPPAPPPAPRFRPYDEPVAFERVTAAEVEMRAMVREQERQIQAEQNRIRQAESELKNELRKIDQRARKEAMDYKEAEKERLDAQIESEKKQVEILKQQQAVSSSPDEHLFTSERINRWEGRLKESKLEKKNIENSLHDLRSEKP